MTLIVKALPFLANDAVATSAAYRAGRVLEDSGFMRWPAACWDQPAVVAFADEKCVAGVNYSWDEKTCLLTVDFAWCDPNSPSALVLCLLGLRRTVRSLPVGKVAFTNHPGNAPMQKLVDKLRLTPKSQRFEVGAARLWGASAAPQPS